MAAKQYELGSNVLDWYRDFCPGNSFQVVIRPDITFADVVVGMATVSYTHLTLPTIA